MLPEDTQQATKVTRKKPRYFYGWNIVGASFLAHLSYAEHHSSVLGFFMRPLNPEFGWSRTQVALVQTIARFVEAAVSFFVGPLIDKHRPRSDGVQGSLWSEVEIGKSATVGGRPEVGTAAGRRVREDEGDES